MNNEERKLIITLWENGYSVDAIIQHLPYPAYKAREMVRSLRKDGTLKDRKITEIALSRITTAYNNGTTDPIELSHIFGYSLKTTIQYLKLAGIKRGHPKKHYFPKGVGNKAKQIMHDIQTSNLTLSGIAKKHNVSRQYVYQLKKRIEEEL